MENADEKIASKKSISVFLSDFVFFVCMIFSCPGFFREPVTVVNNFAKVADRFSKVNPFRRCFVYTHRSMPGEPIVVLHVALTEDIPERISSVVRHHRMVKRFSVEHSSSSSSTLVGKEGEDASTCKAAIFYSITSTQRGLQGIELGTHIIKQAVQKLREELPNISQFSTLSPIPGFRAWLLTAIQVHTTSNIPCL